MRKNIRPAEEEMGDIVTTIVFTVVWYGILLSNIAASGFDPFMLIFIIGGLLLPYTVMNNVRRALFYRKQRTEAIALGDVSPGRITGIERQDIPYTTGKHHTLRYRRYYFLKVEVYDPVTGAANTIESQGYRKPIHRYLASDRVNVYTDRSGWKHYIEDFQWKEHRGDPDIFNLPSEFEEVHTGSGLIGKVIFILIAVFILLQILFRNGL